MRIIVRSPNWIGDQILAFPFFYYLRQTFPQAHITVACVPWVQSLQFRKQVNEVLVLDGPIPGPAGSALAAKWNVLSRSAAHVRQAGPWDLAIALPNSFSSAWIFYQAGVKRIRGYSADGRGFLLKESLPWEDGKKKHRVDAYVHLAREVPQAKGLEFWGVPADNPLDPPTPGVLDSFDAQAEWDLAPLGVQPLEPPSYPYWVLAPGTTAESRQWPLESFATLALQLAKSGLKGIILGGKKEKPQAEALVRLVGDSLQDWTNLAAVGALWKVFQQARWTISNDSGLAHVASHCGSPVYIVWGGGNPLRTRPIGPGRVRMLFNATPCWPCERNLCLEPADTQFQCLKGVRPEEVWKELVDAQYV